VHNLSDYWPFFTAFGMLVAAGFGAPIPEEIPTVGAGVWVGANPELGPLRWLILPVCFLGVLTSDIMLYGIGRRWGPGLMKRRWAQRLIPPETWARIHKNYNRYGIKTLLLVRWLPAIRSPMFISAGVMRLSLLRFVLADGIAAMFGHSLLFFLAYWFGDQFQELVVGAEQKVDRLKPLLIMLGLASVAGFLLYHFLRSPVSAGDPKELPIVGPRMANITQSAPPSVLPHESPNGMPAASAGATPDGKPPDEKTPEAPLPRRDVTP